MKSLFSLDDYLDFPLKIQTGQKIFLHGDLGSGKTSLSGYLISQYLGTKVQVKSPTYIYYQRYGEDLYHFDLYRLKDYDAFFAIGGEEILSHPETTCIVEWPELIQPYFDADVEIYVSNTQAPDKRLIEIIYHA